MTLSQRRERPEPVRERPILFSGPMVRAILEGRKSQTRRVMKQPHITDAILRGIMGGGPPGFNLDLCPYGQPGDRLWVRETWGCLYPQFAGQPDEPVFYRATDDEPGQVMPRWRPSIFMPRWASRLTLEVTGVRVERLQDISEDDAKAEGVESPDGLYVDVFHVLWESINADRASWANNPFVWVVEFRCTREGRELR